MINTNNKISWNMLVRGEYGNKKIIVPAIGENGSGLFNEDFMQVFEDLKGNKYAFACDLATKNTLDYFDRNGDIVYTILDYPEVLKMNNLEYKDNVSLKTIEKLQKDINNLVKEEAETL